VHARTHSSPEPERHGEVTIDLATPVSYRLVREKEPRRVECLRVFEQI